MPDHTGQSNKPATDGVEELTFEKAFARLTEISRALDASETSLEMSFNLYEEGQKLLKKCQGMLDRAEKRLKLINMTNGGYEIHEKEIGEGT